jgi:hypothetical protein
MVDCLREAYDVVHISMLCCRVLRREKCDPYFPLFYGFFGGFLDVGPLGKIRNALRVSGRRLPCTTGATLLASESGLKAMD